MILVRIDSMIYNLHSNVLQNLTFNQHNSVCINIKWLKISISHIILTKLSILNVIYSQFVISGLNASLFTNHNFKLNVFLFATHNLKLNVFSFITHNLKLNVFIFKSIVSKSDVFYLRLIILRLILCSKNQIIIISL